MEFKVESMTNDPDFYVDFLIELKEKDHPGWKFLRVERSQLDSDYYCAVFEMPDDDSIEAQLKRISKANKIFHAYAGKYVK